MNREDFWYIKLNETGQRGFDKQPSESWGGHDADFETNENVYTWDQTQTLDHSNFGIVGSRSEYKQLLIIDFDAHKIDDFDNDDLNVPSDGMTIVGTHGPNRDVPGYHFYLCIEDTDVTVDTPHGFVDLQGDNHKRHVVSPWHEWASSYEILHDPDHIATYSDVTALNEALTYQDKPFVTVSSSYTVDYDHDGFDRREEPPDNRPICLQRALEARRDIPRDGSHSNPWKVDSALGRRLVGFGYSKEAAMEMLREFPPRDGYDERETSYQMDMLYKKELHPESISSLRDLGIIRDDERCSCEYCDCSYADLVGDDPKDYTDFKLDTKKHVIVQSVARTGKSYTLIRDAVDLQDDEQIVYISSTHSEAQAAREKFLYHGVEACHLIGKERAANKYDVTTDGPVYDAFSPYSAEEASNRDDINAYQCLVSTAQDADVVVTVPEMIDKLDDFDWLIMTEEAAFSRMLSSELKIMDVQRYQGYDRHIRDSISSLDTGAQRVIDYIDDLEQTTEMHADLRAGARCIQDIIEAVETWKPGGWHDVEDSWETFKKSVSSIVEDLTISADKIGEIRTWLHNRFNRMEAPILNVMFNDGVFTYGDEDSNRRQMFLVGDTERLFVELPDDLTVWTAGNSIPAMEEFHDLCHGEDVEVKTFEGGYTPVQDSIWIIRYSGGRNPNQQSGHVQNIVEEVQALQDDTSSIVVSGSTQYTARHAETIQECTRPSKGDDLSSLERYCDSGMSVAVAENMWCVEGVDTPWFDMGALYNGSFATPREDYIAEKTHDDSLGIAERIRAAQNAILRPSDVPDGSGGTHGTGITPVIVPDRHVPDEIFELLETFGITVTESDSQAETRRLVIEMLSLDAEEEEGTIVSDDETGDTVHPFRVLRRESEPLAVD